MSEFRPRGDYVFLSDGYASKSIYKILGLTSDRLSIMPHPRGNDWLEDEILALKANNVDIVISLLTLEEIFELGLAQEKELCLANNIEYKSLPIAD